MRPSDPLLAGLVDDAALFPPGNAPLPVALAEHARYRKAPWSAVIGPLLCPVSRVDELVAVLPPDQQLRLALVVDATGDELHQARRSAEADPRISLVAVEVAHVRLGDQTVAMGQHLGHPGGAAGYLEVARTRFEESLDLVAGSGWQAAKYRTGGVTPEAFPSETELAAFLVACAARKVPFKLTAGLHHAVRSTTDEGFEAHGLLNVLVATRVAQTGGSVEDVAVPLALRSPDPLLGFVEHWDEDTCTGVREAFRSFGCCGVTDPLGDLAALGLLENFA